MGVGVNGHIDNPDMLTKEMQHFVDCSNQLVKRPPEHYRWIRERIVWGWDFDALTTNYAREFSIPKSNAVWTIKSELGRLVGKISGFMLHSAASEVIGIYRLDLLYDMAVQDKNWEFALAVQREINSMTSRYRARHKQRSLSAANASKKKPGRPKLTAEEKAQRKAVKLAASRAARKGVRVAEQAAVAEINRSLEGDEFAGLTDDEIMERLKQRRANQKVGMKVDGLGNAVPVLSPEVVRRLAGGNAD